MNCYSLHRILTLFSPTPSPLFPKNYFILRVYCSDEYTGSLHPIPQRPIAITAFNMNAIHVHTHFHLKTHFNIISYIITRNPISCQIHVLSKEHWRIIWLSVHVHDTGKWFIQYSSYWSWIEHMVILSVEIAWSNHSTNLNST